jgi:hypothetical protein
MPFTLDLEQAIGADTLVLLTLHWQFQTSPDRTAELTADGWYTPCGPASQAKRATQMLGGLIFDVTAIKVSIDGAAELFVS